MKNIFFLILISISTILLAQEENSVDSKIKSVNVFLKKAEINRRASTTVNKGMSDIVLTNLSQNIDPNSIQVSGKGNVVIMSVSHRMNHVNKAAKSEKVKALEMEIKKYEDANVVVRYKKEALQEEKNMILSNKNIGGANTGVNWEQLENIADFYRERLVDISIQWTALDKAEKENNSKYYDLKNQLNTLTTSLNKPTSEVVVKVNAKSTQQIYLDFSYMVYNAGWTPLYDFRAKDGKDKIDVSFKANVYQNTGVDWENVPLTLSTNDPNQSTAKPELSPWRIYLREMNTKYKKAAYGYAMPVNRMSESKRSAPTRSVEELAVDDEKLDMAGSRASNAQVIMNGSNFMSTSMKQLSTEYTITLNQDIASNNKMHMVNIKEFKVDAAFEHATVPKLDKDAFLMTNLLDWSKYDWLSSEINVFYDGTYVGRSFIDISQVDDTLSLSLGRDKKIAITREKIKDYCETKSIGLNKKKTVGYEIIVRNNKKTTVNLKVEDQLPISQQEDVEVKVIDISKASHEENTGFLDWDITLKPGETKKLYIKYEIKYPRKYRISGI